MSNIIDKIRLSGTDYTLSATTSGVSVVEVTQAEYDALPTSAKTDTSKMYVITDAEAGDLSQYWTSAQTSSAITQAVSGKVDTTTFNTYSGNVETALSGKQDTLVSGTNIKTINNESILGSGNIDIQGGGGSITIDPTLDSGSTNAVANSAITNAINSKQDSSKLPTYIVSDVRFSKNNVGVVTVIKSNGGQFTSTNNVITINNQAIFNNSNLTNLSLIETSAITTSISSSSTDAQVPSAKAVYDAIQEGGGGKAIEAGRGISITTGATADTVSFNLPISAGSQSNSVKINFVNNNASGWMSFAQGRNTNAGNQYQASFGQFNTSFYTNNSFGDNNSLFVIGNGESASNNHNVLDARDNGDIYIADTNDTATSNYWEKPMVRLQDTITATAANTTALGGLSLVKLSQSEYDALANKDSSTLYVIVN